MRYLLLLLVTGCTPDKQPALRQRDYDKDRGSAVTKDDKPLYREVTDEFGVHKGWKF